MSDNPKISTDHLRRCAVVYARQSSSTQVENNRESTARRYHLAERAIHLGWPREQVRSSMKISASPVPASASGPASRA